MKNKKLHIPAPVIELGIVTVLVLVIWIFAGISVEGFIRNESGGCLSVVLDKPAVKGADRIVIYEGDQVITLTDKETVRQIAGLFTVANRTDLCDYSCDRRLEIYNGNRMVREVLQNCDGSLYQVYERDLLHWVFPSESGNGQVELSREETQWLDGIIGQYR